MPSIVQLESQPESIAHHRLLKLFAYGTCADLTPENVNLLPPLNEAMLLKLRQLTVISLASQCRSISYSQLVQQLSLDGERQLEDLIIDSVYRGVMSARLDPKHRMVHVESWKGRDVPIEATQAIMDKLNSWTEQCSSVEQALISEMQRAEKRLAQLAEAERKVDEEVATVRKTVQVASAELDESNHRPGSSKEPKRIKQAGLRTGRRLVNN